MEEIGEIMVKRDLYGFIGLIVLAVLALVALRVWVYEPVTINEQMANQYLAEKDVIIADRNKEIQYGDFVLYTVDKKEYVGRVIAMEGDSVTYLYDVLYRNNEIVPENYLKIHGQSEYYTEDMTIETLTKGKYSTVAKDSYLILNDKRTDLRDSRQFGLITKKQIIGPLTFRLKPFSQFGFIDNGLVQ